MADLDDILNSALDDIEAEEGELPTTQNENLSMAAKAAAAATAKGAEEGTTSVEQSGDEPNIEQLMGQLMGDLQNPEFAKVLEDTFMKLNSGENVDGMENPFAAAAKATEGAEGNDEDVTKTLELLSEMAKGYEGGDPAQAEEMSEKLMESLMQEFEAMGNKEDFQQVVDGMMKQLLNKEVMYTPMKEICEKFPEWLAENESQLSKDEYERYGNQYKKFQQCCSVYENEPENTARIMELMQDVQEYGTPPADLVKDLAPGLQFGADGMPVMPNMGPGMVPPNNDVAQNCAQQ